MTPEQYVGAPGASMRDYEVRWWTRVARGVCAECNNAVARPGRRTCFDCGRAAAARSRLYYQRRKRRSEATP